MIPLSTAALERLLAQAETRSRREFLRAVVRIRKGLPLAQLERAILAQNLQDAVDLVGLEPLVNAIAESRVVTDQVRAAGWFDGLRGLPPILLRQPLLQISLSAQAQVNPHVVEALDRQNLRRITAIIDETREAVRQTLQRGIQAGAPPREVARRLRAVVGLNTRQVTAVENFQARLAGQGRDPAQVERMVARYASRQLKVRTEAIARTEVMTALQAGKRAQWDRLVREGVIQSEDWSQEWVTSQLENVCPICLPLDGKRAPLGSTFGGLLPPAHVRCVCIVRIVLAGFREGESTNRFRRAVATR